MPLISPAASRSAILNGVRVVGVWAVVVTLAALAGVYSLRNAHAALALSTALLLGSIVFVDGGRRSFFSNYGWIPYAWLALALAPDLRFTARDPLDTSISSTSVESFVQVAAYVLVAALALRSRRLLTTQDRTPLRKGPFVLWPAMALGSTVWSLVPLFTFVRALQLFVPISLALLMVRIWLVSPTFAAALWRNTLRLFVRVVTVLILIAFVSGSWRASRFTWLGAHPGVASMYTGLGLLILIAGGRSFLGLRMSGYMFRLLLFGTALYLGETRGVLAGMVLAIAVVFWWTARTKPLVSVMGVAYYAIAMGLVLIAALSQVTQYALRGGTTENITSLSERIPLWTTAFDVLGEANRWFIGFGYGSARVILPTRVVWAGTAHSSWVELLLSIGILGPLLAAIGVLFLLRHSASRGSIAPPALTLSILSLLVATSITGETLAFPGLGFVVLALMHVPVLARRNAVGRHPGDSLASLSHLGPSADPTRESQGHVRR